MVCSITAVLEWAIVPLSAELMTPALPGVPGSPRLFVSGLCVFPLEDELLLAAAGAQVSDWLRGGVDQIRSELWGGADLRWQVGGGIAFRLPIESYPVHLKTSLNYSEQRIDLVASVMTMVSPDPLIVATNSESAVRTVRELTPEIGLDVELARRMGMAFGLFTSVAVGIPLDDEVTELDVESPDGGTSHFEFEEGINVHVSLGLRFSWVGR